MSATTKEEERQAREAALVLLLTPFERRVLDALKEGESERISTIHLRVVGNRTAPPDEQVDVALEKLRSLKLAGRHYWFTTLSGKVNWKWFRPKSARRWIREDPTQ